MRALRISLPLALAALTACPGQPPTTPIAAKDFAASYADAFCQQANRCQFLAPYLLTQCRDQRLKVVGQGDIEKAVAEGRIEYDAKQARACVNGVLATDCLATSLSDATQAACMGALKGKVATGSPCFGYFECAAGFCGGTDATCPATCPETLGEGASCFLHGNGPQCDQRQGLKCLGGVCAKPAGMGQPCIDNNGCQSGLICVPPAEGQDPVCSKLHHADEPCSGDEACEAGLYCRDTTEGGRCFARVAEGKPCGENIETIDGALRGSQCQEGLLCKGAGLTETGDPIAGVCARPADEGQGCTADQGNEQLLYSGCREGLVCPGGLCVVPPTTGACTPHDECKTGEAWCDDNHQCHPRLDNGAPCTISPECKSNYCGPDGCADEVNYCHES